MRRILLSEKNIVVILFVMVLITFSLAQEDSKKMEKMYTGVTTITAANLLQEQGKLKTNEPASNAILPVSSPSPE